MMYHRNVLISAGFGKRTRTRKSKSAMFGAVCAAIVGMLGGRASIAWGMTADRAADGGGSVVTSLMAVNVSEARVSQMPITFGQPFRLGDVPQGDTIVAYRDGKALPTQTNIKARNEDGSVRHAILTILIPSLAGGATQRINLRPVPAASSAHMEGLTLQDLLHSRFDASVVLDASGKRWHLDARALLEKAEQKDTCKPYGPECNQWLAGPLVSEWIVGGPVLDAHGLKNPHLAVYFAVRAYGPPPVRHVRIDVIFANDWAYVQDPQNERYSAKIYTGSELAYSITNLEQYRQTRWHRVVWWGQHDPLYAQLDSSYLQASRAVPRYQNLKPSAKLLRRVRQQCAPMQRCDQSKDMGTTGQQPGIGPLARWTSVYVVDPTYRAFRWMVANDDALGAYAVHYQDRATDEPISVPKHPCATLQRPAAVRHCPVYPHKNDIFPRCRHECRTPFNADEAHHPDPAYVAYLVTGDWYYLEELKFWADWVIFRQNPAYRSYGKGLIVDSALRGQAWALRTLGYAAYILPDKDPSKSYFETVVNNNIDWYNKRYTYNPKANMLHVVVNGYALGYPNQGHERTGTAVWQQSFFAWAVGNLVDLGFKRARKLRNWVANFQIGLMTSKQYCWNLASAYQIRVRETAESPFYRSLGVVYRKTFPEYAGVPCNSRKLARLMSHPHRYQYKRNVMIGYPYSPTGYVANFQIGLAADADSGQPEAVEAWKKFEGRDVKPNYRNTPQFAIIPRAIGPR